MMSIVATVMIIGCLRTVDTIKLRMREMQTVRMQKVRMLSVKMVRARMQREVSRII